jgi:hypothetical protein
VILIAGALVPSPVTADDAPAGGNPNFAGRWRLNEELSDKPQVLPTPEPKKGGDKKEAASETPGHPDATKPPDAGAASNTPANPTAEFTVRQTDVEVTAEDKTGQSRSFYPNGKSYKADEGTSTVRSQWKDGALIFERKNARGWKYTEIWKLTPDGHMRVDTRLEGHGMKTSTSKRIYDRVTEGK